jgi:thymidylate synthase ThyX
VKQRVDVYAHLPRIQHPDGSRKLVDDPDLWFASKINATLKTTSASEIYWDKKLQSRDLQEKFILGVRNHSWNRQHMGAMVVSGVDFEAVTSSLVSSAFTLGKFYKMQQQTRRSVILDEVIQIPDIDNHPDVKSSFEERFDLYWDIVEKRPKKYKGFDPYIQDSFKILPLSVKTRFSGNMDLRTVKGYCRWRGLDYLPDAVRDFSNKLYHSTSQEYPLMFQSYLSEERNSESDLIELQLKMSKIIGSTDLINEPMLWYADHSFLLPENKYFNKIYQNLNLEAHFKEAGPNATFMGYFNPIGLSLQDLEDLFKNKDEASKSATELAMFAFISKVDISGAIDTWRHTRSNRIVQPIYHALDNNGTVNMPALYQRQEAKGADIPEQFMQLSSESIKLYHALIDEGINKKEAINVLPHNFELIQIELMDVFSFLNLMAIRTCIHARPDVQVWAKSLLREVGKTGDFKGIDQMSEEKSNLLARGIVFKYCMELGTCRKCGKDVVYLPDPYQ